MKKGIIITIILLLVTVVTVAATYAFFSASTTSNPLTTQAHQLVVIYTGDTEIKGNLNLVKNKEQGYRRVVSIALGEDSVGAKANFYIAIDQISAPIATEALKWEIYRLENEEEIYVNSGTFLDCGAIGEPKTKCTNGKRIYMHTGFQLPTTTTKFVVYLWLNGYQIGNEALNSSLTGFIGAETENVTAIIS